MKKVITLLIIFGVFFSGIFMVSDVASASTSYSAEDYFNDCNLPTNCYSSEFNSLVFNSNGFTFYYKYDKQFTLIIKEQEPDSYGNTHSIYVDVPSGVIGSVSVYRLDNGLWTCIHDETISSGKNLFGHVLDNTCGYYTDVPVSTDSGTVFFPVAPLALTLRQVVKTVELEKVMTEILYLIPLVIGLIVLALGLRKALTLLRAVLHQA